MTLVAVIALLGVSLWGVKSLLIFSSQNGLLGQLEKLTSSAYTPRGRPLRVWTSNGRFPSVDKQLNAVAVFFLLYCEDWAIPETSLAGFSFCGAWGASWALIMLDSMRPYSQHNLLSWISIPGIIIFNWSHAMFTPLYLAYRLIFTPKPDAESLITSTAHLQVFPWAFIIGYCLPILLLMLPSVTIKGINSKHTIAGWYQQWNIYISLCQYIFVFLLGDSDGRQPRVSGGETLSRLRSIYSFIFALAVVSHWIPILIALVAFFLPKTTEKRRSRILDPWKTLFPANPFSSRKTESASEGGRWLIQWDVFTGTTATIIWAASLYLQAHNSLPVVDTFPLWEVTKHAIWSGLIGGPMAIPVALLWARDELMLRTFP